MLAATHAAFSTALYLGGAAVFEYPTEPVAWGLAILFSFMPDIDIPTSRVGRPLFFISVPIEKRFGHRTTTHSLIGVGILAALASPLYLVWPMGFWAILGGYWSHIQIDMANIRGVDLFWPSPLRVISQRADMKGRSLRWLVENLQANHDYYLLGELHIDADKVVDVTQLEVYHPARWSGAKVKLHYAKAGDLADYLNLTAIRGEVVVQFWLRPGDAMVEMRFDGGAGRVVTPGVLEGMF
ncbi:metal-dependent hydrolase [Methylotuvimicrobium alcaliphilum]|uniref:Membrane-bound metal-dependent hydrolase n=1 Tax=Methylotuvimicrobium alcaliphilum (strain DSM 19304 / NCIMB 14124 / VKM B-2133 / 20Z) TaxID=1091494 RepID=G4T4N5_META2|nr:metal-dependent hydrolase [Methylotuvimicrobium alcaliphilum]CCE25791.1 protein of unknown function [Methylotuvimicrobium alcaliphilum 20Z]